MKTTVGALRGAITKAVKAVGSATCAIKTQGNCLAVISSSVQGNIKIDVPTEGGVADCSASIGWRQVNAILGGGVSDDTACTIKSLPAGGVQLKFGGASIKLLTPYEAEETEEMFRQQSSAPAGEAVVDILQTTGKQLGELIAGPLQHAAKSDVRYYLVGINLEQEHGLLRAVGTNGWALCSARANIEVNPDMKEFIMPLNAADAVREVFGSDEIIRLQQIGRADTLRLLLTSNTTRWMSGTIAGKYPDWRRVLPKDTSPKSRCELPRSGVVSAIHRILAASGQNFVNFSLSDNGVELLSPDGEQKEFFQTEISGLGDLRSLSATGQVIARAIASVKSEKFFLNFDWEHKGASGKFIICADDHSENEWVSVVMPARV